MMGDRRALLPILAFLTLVGCGGGGGGKKDGGAGEGGQDAPGGEVSCSGTSGTRKASGQACTCAGDCQSGFCVDGVCCDTACTETCKACNLQASPGTCSLVPAGQPPRTASICPKSDASTCGLNGMCDGRGACQKYPSGITCHPGTCNGASVDGVDVCDGAGRCKPGPATICAPFNCNTATNACVVTCTSDADCTGGQKCVNGSCGKKPRGAVCGQNTDCASGFCADGVCCNVACKGACITCNQLGREGTCWPIDAGNADLHGVCAAQGASTCGQTGTCDGFGGCAKYPAETVCVAPSCSGDRLNTAGTCDGLGACRAPGIQNCTPYRCVGGACNTRCTGDADCVAGHACVQGSCGPKQNGQACATASECASNFCVDGVCCADACQAGCHSCALPSSLGKCTSVPAGSSDPRGTCTDQGADSCGTDSKCDGSGSCRKYAAGTVCAPEKCASNVYTPPGTCTGGNCVVPASRSCAPFACNGNQCFAACTGDGNCAAPNVCNGNSCGKKMNGATCSVGGECQSGNCAQGVCCSTACAGACRSCALTPSMGVCSDVPTSAPDPAEICTDQGAPSCGTDGKCEAGACQKYGRGIPCKDPSCTGTSSTPGSTCDGAGACVTPASSSCFPFRCGASVCKSSCTADADCATPAVCSNGSCGLKPPGAACVDGTECTTTFCAQGVCCDTACTGTCQSCAITGSAGTCTFVPIGATDPGGRCSNAGAASCGTTGLCNGAGGCALYIAGTVCAPPTCPSPGTMQTLARTCDGLGVCRPATTQSCAPYACNGTACNATCTADSDCASPDICDLAVNSCGNKKRLGQACTAGGDCLTGNFCVDGVCCSTASCGSCRACNVVGKEGACADVTGGAADPHGRCPPSPPCGFIGTCDGAGACLNAPTSTSCGTASCVGMTFTPIGNCNGAGACKQTSTDCGEYVCGSSNACLTTCGGNGDCIAGDTCQGGSCTSLSPNGAGCSIDATCISGHCVQNVCCGSVCVDMGAASCGTTGACDGTGACVKYPVGTVCSSATCPMLSSTLTAASTCNASGQCVPGGTSDCAPFACNGASACNTSCVGQNDCASGASCVGGACQ